MRTTTSRSLLTLAIVTLVALAGPPAAARAATSPGNGTTTRTFAASVPAGGRLVALPSGEVVVRDARGRAIAAYDAPWASDSSGRRLPTSTRIEGSTIVVTVRRLPGSRAAVLTRPARSAIGRSNEVTASRDASTALAVLRSAVTARPAEVTVPSNYVYDPSLGVLHDYCTAAPDEFPAPGAPNADFRGPCARHDLCYAGSTAESTCDDGLLADLRQNCNHYYDPGLLRITCRATARVYWVAVVLAM